MNFLLCSERRVFLKGSSPGVVFSFAVQDHDNARVLLAMPTKQWHKQDGTGMDMSII